MEGMRGVPLADLWCQCQGNASATPHAILVHQQMMKLHADAQKHALWYVFIVLFLYVFGLVIIIRRSGMSERHTALSALILCFTCCLGVNKKNNNNRERQDPEPKDNKANAVSIAPKIQQPSGNSSFKLQLTVPEEKPSGTSSIKLQLTVPEEKPSGTSSIKLQLNVPEEKPSGTSTFKLQLIVPEEKPPGTSSYKLQLTTPEKEHQMEGKPCILKIA